MSMHKHTLKYLFHSLILLLLLAGCSSTPQKHRSTSLETGIEKTQIVLIGETHDDYAHHLNQLKVIQITHEKWGGGLSIGLEMVQQPFQSYLDDYISGKITEREMLRGTQWYSRWGYDFRLYRPIFNYARQNKISLIALNIPQELSKKISKIGITGLTSKERQFLPKLIDKSNTEYTASLRKIFGMHAHGKTFNEEGFEKFVEAQLAWDEGMAFAASNYLKKYSNKRLVILAGSGHLINRAGIPNRIDRQLKSSENRSINRSIVILSHADKEYSKEEADFSLITEEVSLEPAGLIGINMKDSEEGVIISKLSELGTAQKGGLQINDLLLKLNGEEVKTTSDINLWRLDKKPNEKVTVQIRRGNNVLNKILILGSAEN